MSPDWVKERTYMPETRHQVVLKIISFGMFDDYYSMIPPSRRELRHKDLRKNWVGQVNGSSRSHTRRCCLSSELPKSKTQSVTCRDRLLRVSLKLRIGGDSVLVCLYELDRTSQYIHTLV